MASSPAASATQPIALHPHKVTKERDPIVSFLTDLMAGGLAGAVSKTAVAPIERVKLILQTQDASVQIAADKRYKGIWDAFTRIPREQGAATRPTSSVTFPRKLSTLPSRTSTKSSSSATIRGKISGSSLQKTWPVVVLRVRLLCCSFIRLILLGRVWLPMWVLKGIVNLPVSDGMRGLYGGFGVSVGGIIVYRAAFFGGYDTAKSMFIKDVKNPPVLQSWLIAQAVTTMSGFVSYPFDTVRRRIMMQAGRTGEKLYSGTLDCWVKIARNEGSKAFFKGALSNVIRGSGGALVLVLYDQFQAFIGLAGDSSSE